ncbi:MAG: hypothetical protein JST44_25300 [Cyanobacteria bacterium SZAS LIN-5]|nr:hypothetical protein [Cyanobacteria bacterium SZAS LIN-5]
MNDAQERNQPFLAYSIGVRLKSPSVEQEGDEAEQASLFNCRPYSQIRPADSEQGNNERYQ